MSSQLGVFIRIASDGHLMGAQLGGFMRPILGQGF